MIGQTDPANIGEQLDLVGGLDEDDVTAAVAEMRGGGSAVRRNVAAR